MLLGKKMESFELLLKQRKLLLMPNESDAKK